MNMQNFNTLGASIKPSAASGSYSGQVCTTSPLLLFHYPLHLTLCSSASPLLQHDQERIINLKQPWTRVVALFRKVNISVLPSPPPSPFLCHLLPSVCKCSLFLFSIPDIFSFSHLPINNQQQPATSSSQVSFLLTGLLPLHRFPLRFQLLCFSACLWMFMDVIWMFDGFWNFDLFHTGPHAGTHTSHKAQWYHIYT